MKGVLSLLLGKISSGIVALFMLFSLELPTLFHILCRGVPFFNTECICFRLQHYVAYMGAGTVYLFSQKRSYFMLGR